MTTTVSKMTTDAIGLLRDLADRLERGDILVERIDDEHEHNYNGERGTLRLFYTVARDGSYRLSYKAVRP